MKIIISRNKREGFYVGSAIGYHCRQKHFANPYWKKHRLAWFAYDYMLFRIKRKEERFGIKP